MKIPTPTRLPSGNYNIRLRLDGQNISITRPTATECRTEAQLLKAKYKAGEQLPNKKAEILTLREAIKQYISNSEATLSPATIRGYTQILNNRFKPYMDKKISDVQWQRMIDKELLKSSEKTVKNAWGLARSALKFAGIEPPQVKLAKVPIKEIAFLQPEEIKPFCKALEGRSFEIPVLLELHGMRLSEVLGLDWSNIDLNKKLITVNGARVRSNDGMVYKKTNKNQTSTRKVPIMIPQLLSALQAVEDKTGSVAKLNQTSMLKDVKRTCQQAKVTEVTNHGLRHSFASLCYHLDISERQLMAWGGWSDYATMHKIYIRLAASDESDAAKNIENFFSEN